MSIKNYIILISIALQSTLLYSSNNSNGRMTKIINSYYYNYDSTILKMPIQIDSLYDVMNFVNTKRINSDLKVKEYINLDRNGILWNFILNQYAFHQINKMQFTVKNDNQLKVFEDSLNQFKNNIKSVQILGKFKVSPKIKSLLIRTEYISHEVLFYGNFYENQTYIMNFKNNILVSILKLCVLAKWPEHSYEIYSVIENNNTLKLLQNKKTLTKFRINPDGDIVNIGL
jgi:hypothetical protein